MAEAFAAAWCPPRGLRWRVAKRLRNHELREVLPVPEVPGRMRRAGAGDEDLAARWFAAFTAETHTDAGAFPPGELGRRYLADGRLRIWEIDGVPVAQAGVSAEAGSGARVGMVYTPPEARRRGHATALVAALSRELLAGGRRRCYLFTDLANPVSNSIYAKIGYRPVADVVDLEFLPA
jgi:predicted GNAT family acetyltransferase